MTIRYRMFMYWYSFVLIVVVICMSLFGMCISPHFCMHCAASYCTLALSVLLLFLSIYSVMRKDVR